MTYKKLTAFLLSAVLLGTAVAACGSREQEARDDEKLLQEETQAPGMPDISGNSGQSGQPADPEEEEGPSINVWGDSMAQGVYGDGVSYPDVLGKLTGIVTHNYGITSQDSVEIMNRCLEYGDQSDDVMIIQMGDNGGWKDIEELIDQHRRMIGSGGSDRYIIVTSTDDPDDLVQIWGRKTAQDGLEDTWYEAAFKEAFGDHVFTARKYLIEHGLEINGLEETQEDVRRAKKGNISLQLRNPEIDNTHLSAAGYNAMAYGLYEKGIELGYWR